MSQEILLTLALIVWLVPLADFVVLIFFHKRLPRSGDWFGTSILFAALALSLTILFTKLNYYHGQTLQATFTWVNFGNVPGIGAMQIDLGLMIDNIAAIMLVVVCIVSSFVHLYLYRLYEGRYTLWPLFCIPWLIFFFNVRYCSHK